MTRISQSKLPVLNKERCNHIRQLSTAPRYYLDSDKDLIEKETPNYQVVQSSCRQCHPFGTEFCEKVEGGFACKCTLGWTGFTCWNSPDQCALTQLQCGPNGKCISDVDGAYCECSEFYDGKQCEHSKLSLESYFFNEVSDIKLATLTLIQFQKLQQKTS
ncbi:unnamed protein product [Cylicocyclus nassatus]|uniref:EGF-like domain-containing protein n=1 Tax=Cylicocyclus nassatus TaxID=53992 RepID=A0AA36GN33_CYLNA|nr:unnamed protein product [Cylicocyclus nassatus]